jgi:general stress protein YciG
MNCPSCNAEIQNDVVIKAAASINGTRGRGASKARDPKKMSEADKKGGWPKGRPRKKHRFS